MLKNCAISLPLCLLLTMASYYFLSHEADVVQLGKLKKGMFQDELEMLLDGDWDSGLYQGQHVIRRKNKFNHCEVILFLDQNRKYSGQFLHKHF